MAKTNRPIVAKSVIAKYFRIFIVVIVKFCEANVQNFSLLCKTKYLKYLGCLADIKKSAQIKSRLLYLHRIILDISKS